MEGQGDLPLAHEPIHGRRLSGVERAVGDAGATGGGDDGGIARIENDPAQRIDETLRRAEAASMRRDAS
jgi:hypothetical protein